MKDYIWVVEMKVGDEWVPVPHEASGDRVGARLMAMRRRAIRFQTRIRKYVRAGK